MTIRTAVIGFGVSGRVFHAPLVATHPAFELSAIVTSDPGRADAARTEHPGTAILRDTDELFAGADSVDLVVVGSPNSTHLHLASRALETGLHVVVDKPVAVTVRDADQLVEVAARADRMLTVFQNRRWDGDFLTLARTIASGALGEVCQLDAAFEWWKPELGPRWKDTTPVIEGGGILYDLGPHLIDQCLRLFGSVSSLHAELDARRAGSVSDDDSFVSLRHENGVRSRLWMSAVAPSSRPRFRVVGTEAVATIWGLDPQERQLIDGLRPGQAGYGTDPTRTLTIDGPEGRHVLPLDAGDYPTFYTGVAAAIDGGAAPPVDPADAITALALIEGAVGS